MILNIILKNNTKKNEKLRKLLKFLRKFLKKIPIKKLSIIFQKKNLNYDFWREKLTGLGST